MRPPKITEDVMAAATGLSAAKSKTVNAPMNVGMLLGNRRGEEGRNFEPDNRMIYEKQRMLTRHFTSLTLFNGDDFPMNLALYRYCTRK